ncbi:MAG: hypothetical protein ABF297_12950 [Thiogranum sp.]
MVIKRGAIVALLASFVFFTGCAVKYQAKPMETPKFLKNAFSDYEAEAFGSGKTYAIVSIIADPTIRKTQGDSSLSGVIKAASKKSGYWQDSDRIFKETTPLILQEFQRASSFDLMPSQAIVQDPLYQSFPEDTAKIHFITALVAENYKYFDGEQKLADLANMLGVDGVIVVTVRYGFAPTGANYNGLLSVGSQLAVTNIAAHAVDLNGKTVWKASANAVSDKLPDQSSVGESVNFEKLHPYLVRTTQDATKKLLTELQQKVSVAAN